jgi:ubiquinone/menaquinone biosynthesis C-methylase UbiE
MEGQSLEAKLGEIKFRRLLARQQVEGEAGIADEFDSEGIRRILAKRMDDTRSAISGLKARGIPISPYLEVGAERGQRSLVLENDFGARGAAADLSFDMLRVAAHYSRVFELPRLPMRVLCDIYALPFRSGSLPFVFCWETLHHFPEPGPVIHELHRVLVPGGFFYFDEEPFQQVLRLPIFRGQKAYSHGALEAGTLRKIFERFLTAPSCNEIAYGIIENHSIPIAVWREALADFTEHDVTLATSRGVRSQAFGKRATPAYALAYLLGGSIHGLCRKAGSGKPVDRIEDALVCPECRTRGAENALRLGGAGAECASCGTEFRAVDGVLFLLSAGKMRELYPEFLPAAAAVKAATVAPAKGSGPVQEPERNEQSIDDELPQRRR